MRYLQLVLCAFLFWTPTLPTAQAHAFLHHANPKVGDEVKQQPHEVRIWFTEPVVPAASRIQVLGPKGKEVDKKDTHADANDKALLCVSLPSLAGGTYKVIWRVTSVDGHVTSGDFAFRIGR